MCTTPAANSAKAAPRRHSPPDVFLAVRRRASRPCSRRRSVPTSPSLRQSHFGRDFEGELAAAVSRRWRPSFPRDHHRNHGLWHVNLALTIEGSAMNLLSDAKDPPPILAAGGIVLEKGYFNRATAAPTLNANLDQALPFKRSQVSRQCRPIHAHEFGESGNRNDFIASNGSQDGKLRCAKTDGSQRVVI